MAFQSRDSTISHAIGRALRAHRSRLPFVIVASIGVAALALRSPTGRGSQHADAMDAAGAAAPPAASPRAAPRDAADRSERAAASSSADPRALCLAPPPGNSSVRSTLLAANRKVRAWPERPDAWVDLGHGWMQQLRSSGDSGFALNAQGCADVAREITPDHARALGLLALVRLDAHEFAPAREIAEALLARDPDDPSALATLSDAALELGDVSAARDAAQRLIDRAPGLGAYARASYLRWLHGDEPGAIELARLAIDAAGDPNDLITRAWTIAQAAQLFWHCGDLEGAEAGYRMALDVRADYAPALLGLGKVAVAGARLKEAAEVLSRALAVHADVETAALLGEVLHRLGDAVGAARQRALVERLGRHDRRALALFHADQRSEAARAVELARAELGGRGDIYTEDALAWALYAAGAFAEAETHAERATRLGTRDARLLYHLGAIRLALGKNAEARALLERALQQNPAFDPVGAPDARQLLGRARS